MKSRPGSTFHSGEASRCGILIAISVARLEHAQGQMARDHFAEAILCLQHDAEHAWAGAELQLRHALGVGGKTLLRHNLAQLPVVRVGQILFRGGNFAAAAPMVIPSAERRALHLRGLLELVNLHPAFGLLRFAVERCRLDLQLDRVVCRLPVDLTDEFEGLLRRDAVRERLPHPMRQSARLDEIVLLLEDSRAAVRGVAREFVARPLIGDGREGGLVAGVL